MLSSNMEPRGIEHWTFSYGALVSLHKDSSLSDNSGLTVQDLKYNHEDYMALVLV